MSRATRMDPLLLIAGGVATVSALGAMSYYFEKKRTKAFEEAASRLNFAFEADAGSFQIPEDGDLDLFKRGRSRSAKNLIHGTNGGFDIKIFDYKYVTGSGKNSNTHKQTVVLFRIPGGTIPRFALRPENIFHKMGKVFGYPDIDFEQDPTFSKMYLLQGPSESDVRRLFTPDVLSTYAAKPGWSTDGCFENLVFYRHDKRVAPDELVHFLGQTTALASLFYRP